MHQVLAKIALKVQVWITELQTFHKLSLEKSAEVSKLEVSVAQLQDKLRSFEKTEELLDKSLR